MERKRLEAEFHKLREFKRKAEQYAIEAKQTAQRLSAENSKLREDLSREKHYNEVTRGNIIRECEEAIDRRDKAQVKLEMFEQEVAVRAQKLAVQISLPKSVGKFLLQVQLLIFISDDLYQANVLELVSQFTLFNKLSSVP